MHWIGAPDDPGAADFKASQKREFQHADFSGFALLFDPYKDFSSITMSFNI